MKTQEFVAGSMTLGPFLTLLLASRDHEFESHGLQNDSNGALTDDIVLSRDEKDAAEASFAPPRVVTLGPMTSGVSATRRTGAWWDGLTQLMTLCSRSSRHDRMRWQVPTLPPGCVMVVRYASR